MSAAVSLYPPPTGCNESGAARFSSMLCDARSRMIAVIDQFTLQAKGKCYGIGSIAAIAAASV